MIVLGQAQQLLQDGHGLFESCHASTIVKLPGGDLLAAFFAGKREGEGDTAIWLSRCIDGAWQPPLRQFAQDGTAHWNPVLHAEGNTVWLFYKTGPTVHSWVTSLAISADGGRSWSEPRPLIPGDPAPRGPVKNKLIVLAEGGWLAPGSVEDDRRWDAFTDRSSDHGKSWTRADVPLEHVATGETANAEPWQGLSENALWETDPARIFAWDGVIQPTLWESQPGHLHMLLRSTRGQIYRSDSHDGGRNWCAAYATSLPNNNSGLDVVRLSSGALVLACNPVAGNWGRRSPISLLHSVDNGESWSQPVHMQTREGEFSYPAIIASGDRLDVTYTADRRTIIHQVAAVT